MRLQQEGYSKQITNLLDDLNKLNSLKTIDHAPATNKRESTKTKDLKIDDSAIDEESLTTNTANAPLSQPQSNHHFTSTAEFYTTKTITVPSHEASNIFLIESDKNDEPFGALENKSNNTSQVVEEELHRRIEDLEKKLVEQNSLRNQIENSLSMERAQFQAQIDALQSKLVDQNQMRSQVDYLQRKTIEQNELQSQMDQLQRKYDELFSLYERTQKENEYMKTREKELLADREKHRDIENKLELELQKLKQKEFYMEERYQEKCNQEMYRQKDELEKNQRNVNEKEMQKLLEKLNEQLEQTKLEKKSIEGQLNLIHAELKTYQGDNMALTNKYEKQVHNLNEQLKLFQVRSTFCADRIITLRSLKNILYIIQFKNENLTALNENSELKQAQSRINSELKKRM